jgi:hypothetical protein
MTFNSNKSSKKSTSEEIVFNRVKTLVTRKKNWLGTMTELMFAINGSALVTRNPANLRVVLNKVVNRLRNQRISVKFFREKDRTRTRFVQFTMNK